MVLKDILFLFFLDSEATVPLTEDMTNHEHERSSQQHWTWIFTYFQNLSKSSSSIFSPHFLGLCFLVFLYYLGYAYLQVRVRM